MLIIFQDDSCSVPSLSCVLAREISYDADDGTLWFSDGENIWELETDFISANHLIRQAYLSGKLDMSDVVFHSVD